MADEQNITTVGADVGPLIAAMDAAKRAVSETANAMRGDATIINNALKTVGTAGGQLQDVIATLESKGGAKGSEYLVALATQLKNYTAETTRAAAAAERLQRAIGTSPTRQEQLRNNPIYQTPITRTAGGLSGTAGSVSQLEAQYKAMLAELNAYAGPARLTSAQTVAARQKTALFPTTRNTADTSSNLTTLGGQYSATAAKQNDADAARYESTLRAARLTDLRAAADQRQTEKEALLAEATDTALQRLTAARNQAAAAAEVQTNLANLFGRPTSGLNGSAYDARQRELESAFGGSGYTAYANRNNVPGYGNALYAAGSGGPQNPAGFGGDTGGGDGFGGGFSSGFSSSHGGGAQGLGFTIGQATKYSLVYSTMYRTLEATSQLFKDAFDQAVAFQKSVAELQFQTGQSADSAGALAKQLQSAATAYGESGSVGIEAGQKALGLYGQSQVGVNGVTQATQDATAVTAAKVVTQLAYVTGKPVDELVEGLGALTKAFGQGAESISSAADIVVKFGQIYHVNAADLAAAAPKLAPLAQTVGFSQKEAIALEAAASARSGQDPTSVVSGLDTLLAKGLSGPLIAEMQKLGIDPTQTIRNQLFGPGGLAEIFNSQPSKQDQILGAAGRGGTNRDLVASILEAGPEALATANSTQTEGSLDTLTKLIQGTLGGALRTLAGDAKNLSVELGQSGLFDIVGALIVALDKTIKTVNDLLSVFNLLPRPIKDAIEGLTALAIATKLGAFNNLATKGVGYAEGAVSSIATKKVAGTVAEDGTLIAGTGIAAGGGIGARLGAAAKGIGVLATVPLEGLAAAALPATVALLQIASIKESYDKHQKAVDAATDALVLSKNANLGTAETANTAADALNAAAGDARKNSTGRYGLPFLKNFSARIPGIGLRLSGGFDTDEVGAIQRGNVLDTQAELYRSIGARNDSKAAGLVPNTGPFGDFETSTLTTAFAGLKASGESAAEILRQFTSALDENGKVTQAARDAQFDFSNQAKSVYATINSSLPGDLATRNGSLDSGAILNSVLGPQVISQFASAAKSKGITDSKLTSSAAFGLLSPIVDSEGAKAVANGLISQKDLDTLKSQFLAQIAAQIAQDAAKRAAASNVDTKKTAQDALDQYNLLAATYTDQKNDLLPGDKTGLASVINDQIKSLKGEISSVDKDDNDPDAAKKLYQLRIDLRNLLIDQATNDVAVAKAAFQAGSTNLTGNALAVAGQAFSTTSLQEATKAGDVADITALLTNGSKAAADAVIKAAQDQYAVEAAAAQTEDDLAIAKGKLDAITQAVAAARAASDTPLQIKAAGQTSAAQLTFSPVDDANAAVTAAQAALQKYQLANPGVTQSAELTTLQGNIATATRQAGITAKNYAEDIAKGQNDIAAAQKGGGLAAANAQVADAILEVKASTGDIVRHNAALVAYYQALNAQTQAILDANKNKALLGIDLTNPVQVAQADLNAANAKLKADTKAGAGSDILNQDKLDVRGASNNAQKAKYDQYNSDLQTNLDLGQITQSSFLNSVDAEISDLTQKRSLLKKTDNMYQQYTDEINDLAKTKKNLQDSLNAQFNLGSITVPTVADARRYAAGFVGPGGSAAPSGNAVNITIYSNSSQDIEDALHNAFGGGNGFANVVY